MVQSHGTRSQHQPPKLLEQVCEAMRVRHESLRTEATSLRWIKRFILFHGKRHPREMGGQEVQQFLSPLAVEGHGAASTQRQALSAIVFLYQQVLKQTMGSIDAVVRAKQPHRVPVVLTQDEVRAVLEHLSGPPWIMATLLYGAGLRLLECLRLRVQDVDFVSNHIVVRDDKGHQDRVTMLPQQVKAPFQRHLHDVQQLHAQDVQAGAGHVYLPYALERTYPNANRAWVWHYVFPAAQPSRDPRTGIIRQHAGTPATCAVVVATTSWAVSSGRGPTRAASIHRHAGAQLPQIPGRPSSLAGTRSPVVSVSHAGVRAMQCHLASRCTWGTGRSRRRCRLSTAAWCAARLSQAHTGSAVTPRTKQIPVRSTRTRSIVRAIMTLSAAVRRPTKTVSRVAENGVAPV